MKEKEKQVYQILKQFGYNDKQISGIMANISVETGGTFDYTTKQKGGNGYGLFQFDFLKPHYNKYIKDHKLQDSAKSQIQFMHSTIRGENKQIIGLGNANKINHSFKNGTVSEITEIFCTKWQKPGIPHLQRRLQAAKNYEKILMPSISQNKQGKVQVQKPFQIYSATIPTISNTPSLNFGSKSSFGFGLSTDGSNYGYFF